MPDNIAHLPAVPQESIADQLRALAEHIEAGGYGGVVGIAYVIDCGDGRVEVSLCGQSPLPGAHSHLLLAMGMRKLELLGD